MPATPTGRPHGGANAKPTAVKQRLGNPGKRPLPEPRVLTLASFNTAPPEPVRPLSSVGRSLWDRTLTAATWVDPVVDIECLQMLCEQADERASLRYRVLSGEGDWRERSQLRALDAQIMAGLAALGLSPVDRARMGIGEVPKSDPLDELRARRNG